MLKHLQTQTCDHHKGVWTKFYHFRSSLVSTNYLLVVLLSYSNHCKSVPCAKPHKLADA